MYCSSDFKKPVYKTGEVAQILNLSTKSIQSYEDLKALIDTYGGDI